MMKRRAYFLGMAGGLVMAYAFWLIAPRLPVARVNASQTGAWTWEDALDAVTAAPESHEVVLENDDVRVLLVEIAAGEREPAHTHRDPSVMIVHQPSRIRYFGASGDVEFESPEGPLPASAGDPQWMEPEGLHAVENIGTRSYRAYRIELKGRAR